MNEATKKTGWTKRMPTTTMTAKRTFGQCVYTEECATELPMPDQFDSQRSVCSAATAQPLCHSLFSVLWSSLVGSIQYGSSCFSFVVEPIGTARWSWWASYSCRLARLSKIGTHANEATRTTSNRCEVSLPPRWPCGYLPLRPCM